MSPPNGSWQTLFAGGSPGWWQSDLEVSTDSALKNPTVYACVTQIASDIGKLGLRLTALDAGIWEETQSPAFSGVLRRPNHFQTRQKFIEQWIISKLTAGNFYALKARDGRGIVSALYPLDPQRVTPLVSTSGAVFYRVGSDNLSGLEYDIPAVPASEIIHDTMECLFHPLVGVSPIYAAGLAAMQGVNIQTASSNFFKRGSRPGGILSAPEEISDETAARLKKHWEDNFSGDGAGRVAVLGDGLKYEAMSLTAEDSQLIEQLRWSDEKICSVFKVPPYKVYVGSLPTYQNAEVLDRIYYAGCLQRHIESIEALLDDGLSLPSSYRTEFDLDDLLRMDTATKMKTVADGIGAAILSPNEGRRKFNLRPVPGGETPYLQQQNYSLAALDKRDQAEDPFGRGSSSDTANGEPPPASDQGQEDATKALLDLREERHQLALQQKDLDHATEKASIQAEAQIKFSAELQVAESKAAEQTEAARAAGREEAEAVAAQRLAEAEDRARREAQERDAEAQRLVAEAEAEKQQAIAAERAAAEAGQAAIRAEADAAIATAQDAARSAEQQRDDAMARATVVEREAETAKSQARQAIGKAEEDATKAIAIADELARQAEQQRDAAQALAQRMEQDALRAKADQAAAAEFLAALAKRFNQAEATHG